MSLSATLIASIEHEARKRALSDVLVALSAWGGRTGRASLSDVRQLLLDMGAVEALPRFSPIPPITSQPMDRIEGDPALALSSTGA